MRKILNPRNTHEKYFGSTKYPPEKFRTHEPPTRKKFGLANTHEKILGPRSTYKKNFGPTNTHEKHFGLTKYTPEKIPDPQSTHEKKNWTHEIPTRKNFEPTKYPREKN